MTGLCVVGALLALVVKRGSPETALLLAVGAAVVVALALAGVVKELLAFLGELGSASGVSADLFVPLYKTIGIALVVQVGGNLCRDAGESALASVVETAGTLCALLAGEEGTRSGVWDEPDGPRLAVTAAAPQKPWVEGAFEFAKAGFALLAERYPDNVRFADLSGRGEQSMVDLQLFASEGGDAAAPSAPALSHAQAQQAIASGTMKADDALAN